MLRRYLMVLFALIALTGCSAIKHSRYDVVVSAAMDDGAKIANPIQAAIDAAPSGKKNYRIYIEPGNYYEKIIIAKPGIELIGAGQNATRIYYDAYAGQQSTETGATRGQIWGTTGAATLIVRATRVQLRNLTIENTFDFLLNDTRPQDDPQRIQHAQAPALHLDKGSDQFYAQDIRILGYQDTLFVNSGRSRFDKVFVAGNIDFIFGSGEAYFTASEIKTRQRAQTTSPHGYITAPSTNINQPFGFTFVDCRLTREENVPNHSVALGRPWHPTTQFSDGRYADPNAIGNAVFINTWMDAHIAEEAWHPMSGTGKTGDKILFSPADARFFEYNSIGPGAVINANRRQLTNEKAKIYLQKQNKKAPKAGQRSSSRGWP